MSPARRIRLRLYPLKVISRPSMAPPVLNLYSRRPTGLDRRPPGLNTFVEPFIDTLLTLSAVSLARAIRTKQASSKEVVTAFLDRIHAVNPALNAIVQLAPERALSEATAADRHIALGRVTGPLHGVPFTAKDVFDTEGIVTAVGLSERASYVPPADAVVVSRMRSAGAILLGKTNCPPGGGGGVSDNPVYGRTNNPYDLARSPGGSSGGEAALQCAAGSAVGLGSDSGGSLRYPAHLCGITALKPTFGRVPNTGAYDHPGGVSDLRTQIGPMSRFSEDLMLTLGVISGPDGLDSSVVPALSGDLANIDLRNLRVGFYVDDGLAEPTPETISAVRSAVQWLTAAGAVAAEDRPACLAQSADITHRWWRLDELEGMEVTRLFRDWTNFRTEMLVFMSNYDILLTPADYRPAALHETRGEDLRFNYTLPFSLTGWPAAVVRAGFSREGLPIGVQIVAGPWRDEVAAAAAMAVEAGAGGWRMPEIE